MRILNYAIAIVLPQLLPPPPEEARLPVVSVCPPIDPKILGTLEANAPVLSTERGGGLEIGFVANSDGPLIGIHCPPITY